MIRFRRSHYLLLELFMYGVQGVLDRDAFHVPGSYLQA